jgi:hypothetical protein
MHAVDKGEMPKHDASGAPSKAYEDEVDGRPKTTGEAPQAPSADRDEVERLTSAIERRVHSAIADQPNVSAPRTCAEVCELQDAICASSSKICTISDGHPEEGTFAERCQWSREQCAEAAKKCERCSD